jgi:hypothetical protein
MSEEEVREFFEKIVFGYMCADIEEMINRARETPVSSESQEKQPDFEVEGLAFFSTDVSDSRFRKGGGNYLCALGLLSYTEFMGGIYCNNFQRYSRDLFKDFLYLMGDSYKMFDKQLNQLLNRPLSVYKVFRCGLAHEYFIKGNSVIYMLNGKILVDGAGCIVDGRPGPSLWTTPYSAPSCGIGLLDDGRYFFIVEKYYEDFRAACCKAYKEILDRPKPSIPERDSGELLIPNDDYD